VRLSAVRSLECDHFFFLTLDRTHALLRANLRVWAFVLDLKTAKEIGLATPAARLLRADVAEIQNYRGYAVKRLTSRDFLFHCESTTFESQRGITG